MASDPMDNRKTEPEDLGKRTKRFALAVIQLVSTLPKEGAARVIGYQLLKAGTSVGANYREAKRGRSKPEFIAKVGIAQGEAEECQYWLELLQEGNITRSEQVDQLWKEAGELQAIFGASIRTARK